MGMGSRLKMQIMVTHPPDFEKPYERFLEDHWADVASWDILRQDTWAAWTGYVLDTNTYVSPPSSLRLDPTSGGPIIYALCNLPETLDLKNGKMISWERHTLGGVGTPKMFIGVTGPGSSGISIGVWSGVANEWHRSLIKWKQGVNSVGDPVTLVTTSTWPPGGPDPVDTWVEYPPMTGSTNRCGVGTLSQSLGRSKYFDITEIWLMP